VAEWWKKEGGDFNYQEMRERAMTILQEENYCTPEKQLRMMDVILHFHDEAGKIIAKGVPCVQLLSLDIIPRIIRMKTDVPCDKAADISKLKDEIDYVLGDLVK